MVEEEIELSTNTVEERVKLFDEHYSILFSSLDIHPENKYYIGKKENRTCRFCGKSKPEVTFSDIAHAIPEAIGNKKIILNEECDICNKFFSENLEVHFDKITKPWRNVSQIKGKKKIPSYKTRDKKSRIDITDKIEIKERIDSPLTEIDETNNTIKITYEIEPYIPIAVYKTFVKMALSVMPEEELVHFNEAISWIQDPTHTESFMNPLKVLTTFVPGPKPNIEPIVLLFKRKTEEAKYPYSIFVLAFGNMIYQIIVPSFYGVDKGSKVQTTIPKFPSAFEIEWKYGSIKHGMLDWTSSEYVTNESLPVRFSFTEKNELNVE